MISNKHHIYISIFCIFFFGILMFFLSPNTKTEVILGNKSFQVEVSDTDISRSRGLSGHPPLLTNQGMLFIFDKPDLQGFWMKDMKFAIDIIWIDENLKISHIEKSLTPETYPIVFYPKNPSLYVLEVSSGEVDSLGLKVGDVVEFSRK